MKPQFLIALACGATIAASGAASAIAQRSPSVEERLTRLETRNRELSDIIEIQKVQARYQHYMLRGDGVSITGLFADSPDVEIELSNKGIMRGTDAPFRYFTRSTRANPARVNNPRAPGSLVLHTSVNPVIEVDKTGTHARALWLSPGITTVPPAGAKPSPEWNYGKYEMEYLKQNGEWRFSAFRWHQIFYADSTKGWVDANHDPGPPNAAPDKPSAPGFYNPYHPARTNPYDPPPPSPYPR